MPATIAVTEYGAAEQQFAEQVSELARTNPGRLLELCDERHPAYVERPAAAVTRMRGWVLLALSRGASLTEEALPFVLEELETAHDPYLVAVAAICLRRYPQPHPSFAAALQPALLFAKVKNWPVDLEVYGGVSSGGSASPLREVQATLAWVESATQAGSCCPSLPDSVFGRFRWGSANRTDARALAEIVLEDHSGRSRSFAELFHGHPTIVAFFYSRCENPNKCTLTVWKLGRVQQLLAERGLAEIVHTAAITYDAAYDTPEQLATYGKNRQMRMDERHSLLRAPEGFETLRRHFSLGVSFFESLVSRHQVEVFVLDAQGRTAASFQRRSWREEDAVDEAAALLGGSKRGTDASSLGPVAGLLAAAVPKCPFCWAAYMSSVGVTGFMAHPSQAWLRGAAAFFLAVYIAALAWRARGTGWQWEYALSLAGVAAIALNVWQNIPALMYGGAAAMLAASLVSVIRLRPARRVGGA